MGSQANPAGLLCVPSGLIVPLRVSFYLQKVAEGAAEVSTAQVCISNRSESVSWELEGCVGRISGCLCLQNCYSNVGKSCPKLFLSL